VVAVEDIAPGLLEDIRETFTQKINSSKQIAALHEAIQNGTATYAEAEDYAYLVGDALSQAFGKHLSSAVLPDGKMYFNIADRVLRPMLHEDHSMVADAAATVQQSLNQQAGIGLKAQTVAVNEDQIDGIINTVSAADNFDDVAWMLGDPVKLFSQMVVDATLKENVRFQGKTGLRPKIIRKAEWKCCEWCRSLAGEYDYPDVPDDIYRRHGNCRCTVDYDPGSGKRQNVHTKKWTSAGEGDIIEERKKFNLGNLGIFNPKDFHNTVRKLVSVDRAKIWQAAVSGKRHFGVYNDAMNKTKSQLQKSIVNRVAQVERHADKIQHPESYVADWASQDQQYQAGLLRKWEKDMIRNAEQAEIEIAAFEKRF